MSNTYRTEQKVVVAPSGEVRQGFREVLNETVNRGQITVVERYNKQEAVIIPYEWLMDAHNGDFVKLVHQVRMAVESAKQ